MRARTGSAVAAAALVAALAQTGPARATATTVAFRCSGSGGIAAMENSYIVAGGGGPCWAHLGHHTYPLGGLNRIGAVSGSVFSVEIQLSPPFELAAPDAAAVVVEASVDGLAWTTLHQIPFPLITNGAEILPMRQALSFSFDAGGAEARFVRIRQPRSLAQGLSGYLDASGFDASLEPLTDPEPGVAPGARSLSCGADVMEGIALGHPCWFGGIDRYDAASFFHTFPLGGLAALDAVRGNVIFLPWRLDDYNIGGSRTAIKGYVQTSTDAVAWTDSDLEMEGIYGVPISFDFALGGRAARFIRIVAERHARFARERTDPSLKHPRGMILDSSLEVSGTLPVLLPLVALG